MYNLSNGYYSYKIFIHVILGMSNKWNEWMKNGFLNQKENIFTVWGASIKIITLQMLKELSE